MIDLQASKPNGGIEVADEIHVVELADVLVLELLFEKHVIFLLEISGSLSFDLVVGDLSLKLVTPLFVTLALDLPLRPLQVALLITLDLGCGQFLFKYLLLELLLIAFLTQSLSIMSPGLFLVYLALHLVHLNLILSLLELCGVGGLHLDLLGVSVALCSFQGPFQLVKINGVLDSQLLQGGLLLTLLSELSLHVREKRA